ncbi:MAG: LysR family transcriptional regulator [Leeuwenhoekiella sp.]|uniref:LysR substrate-binding domain-containing protein n=1 Tax=Marinobacter sp. NP-4(2019) TaxID=2488665 RepID=UPI000C0D0F8F|nr:LysR substrate-binding domain-containing protein [Marinobacter sp. NP-4(2019)]AZT83973.1 LysR family transcriptional regulator [Marinobacter sp. NP-4(2019)]PHR89728.1 MAG: LysR family transcriptional regulator [Leeuwenhoekiella sp.]
MKDNLNELFAFMAVAREQSFTRAAGKLSTSQSSVSQTVKNLEQRLGIRLLSRTTRSVTLTEAGEQLKALVEQPLQDIEAGLSQITELKEKPAGTVRITADEYAINAFIWPRIRDFLHQYPDITVELSVDYGLVDIVAERYDAGVRRGGLVEKDMIALPISPEIPMVVVASPEYLHQQGEPNRPQDLTTDHDCINLRLPTHGGVFTWTFKDRGRELKIRGEGQLIFNSIHQVMEAAVAGYGIAYVPESMARAHLNDGRLVEVLAKFRMTFPGYYLYYTSRLQSSPAFSLLADALRYRS